METVGKLCRAKKGQETGSGFLIASKKDPKCVKLRQSFRRCPAFFERLVDALGHAP